jgi:hypothetical protein
MYEHRRQKLLSRPTFLRRLARQSLSALILAGLLFMPVFHRVLHRFHLDQADSDRAK